MRSFKERRIGWLPEIQRGPKDHRKITILHPGSKAQGKRDSSDRGV